MKVQGTITEIKEKVTGTSKQDKGWSKVEFLLETSEDYNNLYCFEIFSMDDAEKNNVESFLKFNKVGSNVDVDFNVKTSEWQGKHFTSLAAWKVFKSEVVAEIPQMAGTQDAVDDLPF
jgi:hypothetical protein